MALEAIGSQMTVGFCSSAAISSNESSRNHVTTEFDELAKLKRSPFSAAFLGVTARAAGKISSETSNLLTPCSTHRKSTKSAKLFARSHRPLPIRSRGKNVAILDFHIHSAAPIRSRRRFLFDFDIYRPARAVIAFATESTKNNINV